MQQSESILRFITAGSVDDGKSTLIGRLLYDSKSLFEDQLAAVEMASTRKGLTQLDLSLLTDGLKDERAQGITIDVAYRYFTTPKRKFIIADTPGHVQYTRNMVTGASGANLAIILVDARKGLQEQTKRHSYIVSLLQIKYVVLCVNKMDLVDFKEEIYRKIVSEYTELALIMDITNIQSIPVSALRGDNIVDKSENMPWFEGDTLLQALETTNASNDYNYSNFRLAIQTIIRPHTSAFHDYRGYAGRIASGIVQIGDRVAVLPSGLESKITKIFTPWAEVDEACVPQSVVIELEDAIDISRGSLVVKVNDRPEILQDFEAMICWMSNRPTSSGARFILKHTTNEVKAILSDIVYKVDMSTLAKIEYHSDLQPNDIARIKIRTSYPIFVEPYQLNKSIGAFILIEEGTNYTVAAGMII